MQDAVAGTGVQQFADLRLAQGMQQVLARHEVLEQPQQEPVRDLWHAVRLCARLP
jgi:hypothetical protein